MSERSDQVRGMGVVNEYKSEWESMVGFCMSMCICVYSRVVLLLWFNSVIV